MWNTSSTAQIEITEWLKRAEKHGGLENPQRFTGSDTACRLFETISRDQGYDQEVSWTGTGLLVQARKANQYGGEHECLNGSF